ncbi:MAG TPA: PEP/pyruvate-binding domain-containing protein [Candidatus Eisenbacteria bacterium]|nr:PEP/pyruvate-binding domain-containing protein [Candidatus Eisenbacteria bacterium]
MIETKPASVDLPAFDRNFWDGTFRFTRIGSGALGGKASGLVVIKDLLAQAVDPASHPGVAINVPIMAVVATGCFDQFIKRNRLAELPLQDLPDDRIGHAFQKAEFPAELLGDLRALSQQVKTPLAVRSSSSLEDALDRPFAGVYATKMIPNNQFDADTRFRRLVEAIKFVYASTYFREARDYIRTTGLDPREEKMAVIIQEVVGRRHGDRFYPDVSGVGRSYNFYAIPPARPEDGVATLALGLGKTIVDGGVAWTYSPAYPRKPPPFASTTELLRGTQTEFWAVNMGKPPAYDPVSEVEYMLRASLKDAEADDVLRFVASTYDPARDRVIPGVGSPGARILDFSPLLVLDRFPLNDLIRTLLAAAEDTFEAKVEIEFAATIDAPRGAPAQLRLGMLQVRPMVVSHETVDVPSSDLRDPNAIIASDLVMGNGVQEGIRDIVFVRPEAFSPMQTPLIAQQLEAMNRKLRDENRIYLLIGFGRWGSSHPSLGIPVDWSQISGARAIVEGTLPDMNVELSQGSHFFHNLSAFRASYFTVRHDGPFPINWGWLNRQPLVSETEFVRHVRPSGPISVRVDGRSARGVVLARTDNPGGGNVQ